MSVEKWTPERRRGLTRNALVEAAAVVFARRGFEGASLDEIAETAGFTRSAIYKNFGGKEELFLAVLDRSVEQNLSAFSGQFAPGTPLAALSPDELARAWRQLLATDVDTFALNLEFRLYALRNPDVRERYVAHQRRLLTLVSEFIEQQTAAAGLHLAMPAAEIARIVDAASQGLLEAAYLDPEGGDQFAEFLALIMPALVSDRVAPRDPEGPLL